jgi:transposase
MDTEHSAITEPARRLEVFTGAGRRRSWSLEDKMRIVGEIALTGDSVCAVARRHGLSPQQLFGWRRQLREDRAERPEADALRFVPAVVDAASSRPAVHRQRKPDRRDVETGRGTIEVEIDGITVRIGSGVEAGTIAAVFSALRASP